MKDAENKDYSRDLVLRVSPSRNAFVVEEHKPCGIISYREIDPLELYYAISGSYTSNDFLESGFLPDHCLHVSMSTTERNYIIWNPELRADIIYRDTEYQDFPIPRLVFGLRILEKWPNALWALWQMKSQPRIRRCSFTLFPMSIWTGRCVRVIMCCLAIRSFLP